MALFNVTVKGGFWEANGVGSLQSVSGEDGQRRDIRQKFDSKGLLGMREIIFVLVGAAPGATATKNFTRVAASIELGGLRPIETEVLVNRATTAADVAEIQQEFLRMTTKTSFGANPPANLDRNPLGTR
jgi:hypothetical protein